MASLRHSDLVLEVPEGWQDHSTVVLSGPPDSVLKVGPRVSVSRQVLDADPKKRLSAAELAAQFATGMEEKLSDCRIDERGPISVPGAEAQRLVARWKPEGEAEMALLLVFVVRERVLHVFSSDAPAAKMSTFRPAAERIIQSARFER